MPRSFKIGIVAAAFAVGAAAFIAPSPVSATGLHVCNPFTAIFCDNFVGKTYYKDQFSWAKWYRYPFNPDNASKYKDIFVPGRLKLEVTAAATADHYTNTNISTSEINNFEGNFLFGEDTRVEVRMRFSPNVLADAANTGTAKGSAGLLFWNYFTEAVSPEQKDLTRVRDAFGFVWQDSGALPTPGFWIAGVAQGVPGEYKPHFDIDLSQFHTYVIERRHESIKFFIDGTLVHTILLNQEGGLTLPSTSKLSVDMWFDNTTYVFDFADFDFDLIFNDITQSQYLEVDYAEVTAL